VSGAKSTPKRKRKRRAARRPVALTLGLAAGALVLPFVLLSLWSRLGGPGPGRRVIVDLGRDQDVGAVLAEHGLIRSPRLYRAYAALFADRPEPGEHVLNDGLSPRELAARLGRTRARPSARVVLPEGLNHFQIAERLEEAEICSARAFKAAVRDPALRRELGVRGESLEGYLFPATYEVIVDSRPDNVARMLVQTFRARFEKLGAAHPGAREALAKTRRWDEHEIATLASIVEREAAAPEEKPLVASVYLNRLDDPEFKPQKMLQADPTAAYGCVLEPAIIPACAGFTGKITPALLRDASNRYNTYRHPGLPPGPIANPGESALEAVLAPAKTDYLFFVANGKGRHTFSRTFDAHNRAVRGE
jgi:UPF0755 protein